MKRALIQFLMLMFCLTACSQSDKLDSLLTDVLGEDYALIYDKEYIPTFHTLYTGMSSSCKTLYAGREIGDNMFNMHGYVYYFSSKGFFIGASGSWYSEFDPRYSHTLLSVGINKFFGKKNNFIFKTYYSQYFQYKPDPDVAYDFNNTINVGISYRNKWIGTRISSNLLFGHDIGFNVSLGIFSRIPVIRFGKYNKIQLEPEISAYIASETIEYVNSGSVNSQLPDSQPINTTDVYGLLNTQLYLPACFYIGNFNFELSWSVNLPRSQDETITYPVSSFFSIFLGYIFPLN